MLWTHGRSRRRRGAELETLEGRRLPAGAVGAAAIVSLIEFGPNSSRSVSENAGRLAFSVTRTGDLSAAATVQVHTVGGTALEGLDYVRFQTTLTFAPGQKSAGFTVELINDKISEAPFKEFVVLLSNPSPGAGLAEASAATVFIRDDEPASTQTLNVFDFGPHGAWTYDAIEGFRKIADADPQAIIGSTNRSAYLDLGPDGLWSWDSLRGLRKLSGADAEQIVVINNDWTRVEDVVLADFGASGLWRYSDSKGWTQLNHVDPRNILIDRQSAFIDFGHGGVWRWSDTTPWYKINDQTPEGMAAENGQLFLDYGPNGTWNWSVAGGLRKVGDGDPQAIATDGTNLFTDFGAAGLWAWSNASGWRQLNTADPQSMRVAAGTLYLDYGAVGAWTWTVGAGFTRATDAAVEGFIVNPGATQVFVDQGAAGLWTWTAKGYRQINAANPQTRRNA